MNVGMIVSTAAKSNAPISFIPRFKNNSPVVLSKIAGMIHIRAEMVSLDKDASVKRKT
jgi:hypothetical protein